MADARHRDFTAFYEATWGLTVVGIQDTPPDDVVPSVAAVMAADDPGE